jgi:ActR/RegA family two-component response regulator
MTGRRTQDAGRRTQHDGPKPLVLWLIDDTSHHHQVAAATVARVPGVEFHGYHDGASGYAAFAEAQSVGKSPNVVLMDFFLGDDRGDRLTTRLRALERGQQRCTIIGYSSVASGSEAIVAAGGDLIIPKRGNQGGVNPFLLTWLQSWLQVMER